MQKMQAHLERLQLKIEDYIADNKLKIIVKPNSSKNQIIKWDSDKQALRISIKSKPEQGKANLEIVKFFSRLLKKDIKIISGLTSKKKIIRIF